jgi:hypothetical protein
MRYIPDPHAVISPNNLYDMLEVLDHDIHMVSDDAPPQASETKELQQQRENSNVVRA